MAAIDPKLLKDYQRLPFQQQRQILCAGRILEALLLRRQGQTASDDVLMLGINRELAEASMWEDQDAKDRAHPITSFVASFLEEGNTDLGEINLDELIERCKELEDEHGVIACSEPNLFNDQDPSHPEWWMLEGDNNGEGDGEPEGEENEEEEDGEEEQPSGESEQPEEPPSAPRRSGRLQQRKGDAAEAQKTPQKVQDDDQDVPQSGEVVEPVEAPSAVVLGKRKARPTRRRAPTAQESEEAHIVTLNNYDTMKCGPCNCLVKKYEPQSSTSSSRAYTCKSCHDGKIKCFPVAEWALHMLQNRENYIKTLTEAEFVSNEELREMLTGVETLTEGLISQLGTLNLGSNLPSCANTSTVPNPIDSPAGSMQSFGISC
ncbi:hypothetical protein BC834DRAFT_975773 [Gloeopeniophorella convolvens]|nr:hypothetical protein BC834DRAFT_975773 [Gloeopeniophorella convolvens]